MPYPAYDELELPLLKLIYEAGGAEHKLLATATYHPLAAHFNLSEEEEHRPRSDMLNDGRDEPFWNNMVQWARRKLKERGYLTDSSRGYWQLSDLGVARAQPLSTGDFRHVVYPDEVPATVIEGAQRKVTVNSYERSAKARQACIAHYGYLCSVCGFDFEAVYGERGKNFIHVHHVVPVASIGGEYEVDPIKDLRPICPNCHAMAHRTDPPCTLDALKAILM